MVDWACKKINQSHKPNTGFGETLEANSVSKQRRKDIISPFMLQAKP